MTTEGAQLDGMGSQRRSHACGQIDDSMVGQEVVVAGWVHRRRDHGGVIFVDLRDREGIVQVVFRPETSEESHARAGELRSEWVIMVRGIVEARSADTVNSRMKTGQIEITGKLKSDYPAHSAIVANVPKRSHPGGYWQKMFVGRIAKDGTFRVSVKELKPGDGELRIVFCFNNGAIGGAGFRPGKGGEFVKSYTYKDGTFEF